MGEVVDLVGRIKVPATCWTASNWPVRRLSAGQQVLVGKMQEVEKLAAEIAYIMGIDTAADFLATLSVEIRNDTLPPSEPAA